MLENTEVKKVRVFARERIECVFVGLGHKENNIHVRKETQHILKVRCYIVILCKSS